MALMALGMTNLLWLAAAAGMVLVHNLAGRWPRRLDVALTVVMVFVGAWLIAPALAQLTGSCRNSEISSVRGKGGTG